MPINNNYAVFSHIQNRQLGTVAPMSIVNAARGSTDFIKRLGKWRVLTGHDGCVNTIAWNESGDKILSGSDDCHLNIYDVGKNKLLESIRSGHHANIFSARFLPASSDRKIVSCCGGGMVHYNEAGIDKYHGQNYFNCHSGTTYELTVIPGDPNSFLTCGEDGTVRHFDLRVKSNCYCQECRDDILIERPNAITSIMVNPLTPYHLAIGCEDSFVRVYDMRAICTEKERSNMRQSGRHESGIISMLKPPHIKKSSCRVTSLRYNETGSEILVSYCTDYVYLFSTSDQRKAAIAAHGSGNAAGHRVNGVNSEDTSRNLPPVKRLRLRGDWSDTGPNARPENEQDREENNTNSLMQRISDVFSRWLEDAFNEGVNRSTNQSDGSGGENDHESVSGSESPNNVERSPTPPQAEASISCSVTEDNVANAQTMQANKIDEDDVNPVEDMVEDLDLGGSDVSDYLSRFELKNKEKADAVDEAVSDNGNNLESDPILEKFQHREEEESRAVDVSKDITLSVNNSERDEPLVMPCSCGSDEGLFEESCSSKTGNVLNSNKFNIINGDRESGTLSLGAEDFEEVPVPLVYSEVEDKKLMSHADDLSPESMDSSNRSLIISKDSGVSVNANRTLDFKNNSEVNTVCSYDDNMNDREFLSDSGSHSTLVESKSGASNAMVEDLNDIGSFGDLPGRCKRGDTIGNDPREAEIDKTNEIISNDESTPCSAHMSVLDESAKHCLFGGNLSDDDVTSLDTATRVDKTGDLDEIPRYTEPASAIQGSADSGTNIDNTTSTNLDDEMDESSKNDRCETEISRHSAPGRRKSDVELERTSLAASSDSMDCYSHEGGSEEGKLSESALRSDHVTDGEGAERPGTSDEGSAREGHPRTRADMPSAFRVGPLRDVSVRRRHAAATRIQRCFRLQKKKTETNADNEEDFLDNFEIPTPIMCYKGHRNARTMIKEANFWGDRYVISGSDCGRVFVWDKQTGELVVLLEGDKHVVNCVQPHPSDPILATSGIDYDIKVWAPTLQCPAVLTDVEEIISRNEQMLEESRDTITVPASFMLRMLASLSRVRGQRRSQQQDEGNSNEDSDD